MPELNTSQNVAFIKIKMATAIINGPGEFAAKPKLNVERRGHAKGPGLLIVTGAEKNCYLISY